MGAGEIDSAEPRLLAEALARKLDLSVGRCRLELELKDGNLVKLWRHEQLAPSELDRLSPRGRMVASADN